MGAVDRGADASDRTLATTLKGEQTAGNSQDLRPGAVMVLEQRSAIRRPRGAIFALGLAVALTGCAAPQIDAPFGGLESLTAAGASSSAPDDPARLFIIHGITKQDNDYADALVQGLASRLGLPEIKWDDRPYAVRGAIAFDDAVADINLRTYHLSDGRRERLRVSALNWSPLTESIKQHQFASDDRISRALINADIKVDVINDGLSDAVLYEGKYGTVMRRGVMIGLCAFLDGAFVNDSCAPGVASRAEVALISESLGSYMLFDAIEALNAGRRDSPAGRPLFMRLRQFYMFANQLPLLELADLSARLGAPHSAQREAGTAKLDAFLERLREAHATMRPAARSAAPGAVSGAPAPPPLQIVAFTDPNDLLSYEISRANLAENGAAPTTYSASNVLYPVAISYFGVFANPLTAHTGYSSNPEVLDLVICGASGCAK